MNWLFIAPLAAGVMSLGVVVYSFFTDQEFYPRGHRYDPEIKALPKWYGSMLFSVIGILLVYLSLREMVFCDGFRVQTDPPNPPVASQLLPTVKLSIPRSSV
jgi:hypothetical protein